MREFFKKCMEDLEALTGNRQAFYFANDPEGPRKLTVCLDGMVATSKRFDYIPEEAQQKIIRRMMVEDQNYDSLNSRTVHKWLDMHKDKYYTFPKITEQELTPAPPEVADKYAAQLLASLSNVGKQVPQLTADQVAKEGQERKDPYLRGAVASGHPSTPAEEVIRRQLHNEYLRTNYHHITREKLPGWMPEDEWMKLQNV